MSRTIAISQSNYLPWKGWFDMVNAVDEFVLLDDVQYTRRDWRNRNRIKTPNGLLWLTVPVQVRGRYFQRIDETTVTDDRWAERHWRTLETFYRGAEHWSTVAPQLEPVFAGHEGEVLSDLNRRFVDALCGLLGIDTPLVRSSDLGSEGTSSDRILDLCRRAGATRYVSGPAARAYLDREAFDAAGIEVRWFDYSGYPEHRQLHGPFEHGVSVVDLLFNEGPETAPRYMKSYDAQGRASLIGGDG